MPSTIRYGRRPLTAGDIAARVMPGPRRRYAPGSYIPERVKSASDAVRRAIAPMVGSTAVDPTAIETGPLMMAGQAASMALPAMTRAKRGIRAYSGAPLGEASWRGALRMEDIPAKQRPYAKHGPAGFQYPDVRGAFRHHDPTRMGMGAGGDYKGRGIYLTEDPRIAEGYVELLSTLDQPAGHVRTHNIPPQAKIFDSTTQGVSNKMWEDLKSAFKKRVMPEGEYRKSVEELVEQDLNAIGMDVHWMNEKGGGGASIEDIMYQLEQLHQDIWGQTGHYGSGHKEVWNLLQDLGYHGLKYPAGTQFGLPKGAKLPINYVIYDYDVINNPNKFVPKPKPAPEKSLRLLKEDREAYKLGIPSRGDVEYMTKKRGMFSY